MHADNVAVEISQSQGQGLYHGGMHLGFELELSFISPEKVVHIREIG